MGEPALGDEEEIRLAGQEETRRRVREQGFEVDGYEPEDIETCQGAKWGKRRNRWGYQKCGAKALVSIRFRGPNNPDGVQTPFCRSCLASVIKSMLGYLAE